MGLSSVVDCFILSENHKIVHGALSLFLGRSKFWWYHSQYELIILGNQNAFLLLLSTEIKSSLHCEPYKLPWNHMAQSLFIKNKNQINFFLELMSNMNWKNYWVKKNYLRTETKLRSLAFYFIMRISIHSSLTTLS